MGLTGRSEHSCGIVRRANGVDVYSVIVAGGSGLTQGMDSVEVLDYAFGFWRPGPPLPLATFGAVLVTTYNGEAVLVGGATSVVYKLAHSHSTWVPLTKQLSRQWRFPVAFLIPSNLTTCS